jgi:1-acyl-sn-glycerol-3-phosphate acyltransferase
LLGILRLTIALPTIVLATLLILPASWLPFKFKGIGLGPWLCTLCARLAMRIFNVRFSCPRPQLLRQHQGFVFANHIGFFDILMMLHVLPCRFLSAAENKKIPFIGAVSAAIGTLFVDRANRKSRAEIYQQLAQAERFPPLVIYPEGGVGPAHNLQPFKFGSFEICVKHRIPYLLCAIRYDKPESLNWLKGQTFQQVLWKAAQFPGPIHAQLIPLRCVIPTGQENARELTKDMHREVAAELGVTPAM